ncbi:leucine-rich repeat-containing protein 74B-like [Lineus longissimus]|uniref:leucine-rich repeat-containing protein 74B-like n=1 Tax=Lineus longissimus TaxID=88925 RepID=UPI00315D75D8
MATMSNGGRSSLFNGLGTITEGTEYPSLTPQLNTPRILKINGKKPVPRDTIKLTTGGGLGKIPGVFVTDMDPGRDDEETSLFEAFLIVEEQQEEELEEHKADQERARSVYEAACKRCGVAISKAILHAIGLNHVKLKNHSLGIQGIKPLCIALVSNVYVTSLDLEGNDLGAKGAAAVADVLSENLFILDLNLAENKIGTEGARCLTKVLRSNHTLCKLNLSGNDFGESDAKYFAKLLSSNTNVKELCLSHNAFRETGGEELGGAIAKNATLKVLDLSWNHLRLKGAVSICKALEKNKGLSVLNLAWNGFGLIGCQEMATAMEKNKTLEELNLSANRIDNLGLAHLLRGLSENTTLQVIKLGSNPIYGEAVTGLLDWFETYMSSGIKLIDLTHICIDEDFQEKLKCIQRIRTIDIIHGSVVNPQRSLVAKHRLSIFDTTTDPIMVLFEYMKQSNLRLVDFFHVLDRDKSETISKQEFREGLQSVNIPMSEQALSSLMRKMDLNNDGQIDFGEFVVGHKENVKKVSTVRKTNENKQAQFMYLREKVKRLVGARSKPSKEAANQETTNPRTGFVTAVFKHLQPPHE